MALQALSPLDGRYRQRLDSLRFWFSEQGLIRERLRVEIYWLLALARAELVDGLRLTHDEREYLLQLLADFNLDDAAAIKSIEQKIKHDVKAVEYWLQQKAQAHATLSKITSWVHFACTSEDINNLAYSSMLAKSRETVLCPALTTLLTKTQTLAQDYAAVAMLARTHGQIASPTTMGKEFANFAVRLKRSIQQYTAITLRGKMNGAVGNYNAHYVAYPDVNWEKITQQLIAEDLRLQPNTHTTQIEPHDCIAEICQAMMRINTILLDFCHDIWSYIAWGYFKQKINADEVGSSTMPHKVNPIDFENAEGNLGIANALLGHFAQKLPISRWQRDLSDSTVLRNLGVAFGHSLLAYDAIGLGLEKIVVDVEKITSELNQAWEVLTEAVQTVMRRHQIPDAYDRLKAFSRGQAITREKLHQFIHALPLPNPEKQRLLALKPEDYLGLASQLARRILSSD